MSDQMLYTVHIQGQAPSESFQHPINQQDPKLWKEIVLATGSVYQLNLQ